MSQTRASGTAAFIGAISLTLVCSPLLADDVTDLREELRLLRLQNSELQKQLQQQQGMIEALTQKVGEIQSASTNKIISNNSENEGTQAQLALPTTSSFSFGKINLSGEGGVTFFHTGSQGMYPNNEFRVDEARLFLEAPIYNNVYFYGELNLATREEPDVQARLGELYLDIENVSQLWNAPRQLNIRAGRMYVPFGEEYLTRYAIDNPFISHSVSDLWGVDEGVELYGKIGKFSYATALQNGGTPDTTDFTSDKSVALRIGYDPTSQFHVSVSGMRTGNINVQQDQLSAMWFANGFFRSIGSPATTRFQAELVEGDIAFQLPRGHLSAFGGYIHYHDNDPAARNDRDMYYYSVEGVHDIVGKLYGAARFSQILANDGYPIVGNGNFGEYFFGTLTTELWRLSLDLGYRWSQNLLLKVEYSFERGRTLDGIPRDSEDLFAMEAAFRF